MASTGLEAAASPSEVLCSAIPSAVKSAKLKTVVAAVVCLIEQAQRSSGEDEYKDSYPPEHKSITGAAGLGQRDWAAVTLVLQDPSLA